MNIDRLDEVRRPSSRHPRMSQEGRGASAARVRSTPKGRAVDPKAREEVRALLGDAPRRRDLLIEHLHKIQDRYRLSVGAHLVALAAEMKLAMAEVYEVATFYHHFDVVKEGDTAPPSITVRVCDSIACELRGRTSCSRSCRRCSARTSACCMRPASAAARPRPWPWSDRTRFRTPPPKGRVAGEAPGHVTHPETTTITAFTSSRPATSTTRHTGRPAVMRWPPRASRAREAGRRHRVDGRLGAARTRRRRLPGGPQVEIVSPPSRRRG